MSLFIIILIPSLLVKVRSTSPLSGGSLFLKLLDSTLDSDLYLLELKKLSIKKVLSIHEEYETKNMNADFCKMFLSGFNVSSCVQKI